MVGRWRARTGPRWSTSTTDWPTTTTWSTAIAGGSRFDALAALIGARLPEARSVLDCSCGMGTQAIGLSLRDYDVTGTDISERSLDRAAEIARELDTPLRLAIADFRDLSGVSSDFDVVISCDNAIPHLLDDADVDRALQQMHAKLRPGGLLLVSVRDYERALIDRPATTPPLDIPGPPRRIVVRLHEWDAPESGLYTVRFLILTEQQPGWSVTEHATRYRALTRSALTGAAERAGLADIRWLDAAEADFHQPVMTARRPIPH